MREHSTNNPEEGGRQRHPEQGPEIEPTGLRPLIYVASLADYNAGRLHGEWMEAAQEPEELLAATEAMLDRSPEPVAEEWAIHDYEDFGACRLSEYESFETISRLAEGIQEHGPAFAAFAAQEEPEPERLDCFQECYRGAWESVEAYAEDWLEEVSAADVLGDIPEWLRPYVSLDVAGFARDLQLGGDIEVAENPDGGVWIFERNT